MNKFEKIICLVLGVALAWFVWKEAKRPRQTPAPAPVTVAPVQAEPVKSIPAEPPRAAAEVAAAVPSVPERVVTIENDEVKLELTSWGAAVKRVTLKRYARECGEVSAENPAVVLDYASAPLGELRGIRGVAPNAAYEVRNVESNLVVFVNAAVTRKIELKSGYQVSFEEHFAPAVTGEGYDTALSLGLMRMGDSKNDLLSVDSWARDAGKGKPGVLHHCEGDSPLKPYLVGGLSGGCSGSSSAAGMPASTTVSYPGAQSWIAVKNRFFVTALCASTQPNVGFEARVVRELSSANYRPESVAVAAVSKGVPAVRTTVFYAGPKQQSRLWDLGMRDVMEFGMWRWLCYPLVWVLNVFHDWIPNYGIAIILLTILVRVLFWPLTHKSTVGMRKMQELQPKMKAIQAKFKDNPQRLQQETWALYKSEKVNPMSSCLPMLIQIPVFIALFNVLRSAVELRYAPFLWIADLSEPEALFSSWFPFGGLNLLPILMAVSTGLQSAFTPTAGDKSQQKMMMIFMPLMMLVMFYSFPSALSLYWFLSNLFSIVQMWVIRRQTAVKTGVLVPEVIDPPTTRQMRRHN